MDNLIEYLKASEIAQRVLCRIHSLDIEPIDIQNALVEVLNLKNEFELLNYVISSDQIIDLLKDFNFTKYRPEILKTIEFDDSIIPIEVPRLLTEKLIKHKNEIWVIHKYDEDPFPSNPHAHNYETNYKLDLSNGNLYQKKRYVGSIKKKDLEFIRTKAGDIKLPSLDI